MRNVIGREEDDRESSNEIPCFLGFERRKFFRAGRDTRIKYF